MLGLNPWRSRLSFIEKLSKLHPQSFTDVPQRDDSGIALAQF
jgi:hypothetical protein